MNINFPRGAIVALPFAGTLMTRVLLFETMVQFSNYLTDSTLTC